MPKDQDGDTVYSQNASSEPKTFKKVVGVPFDNMIFEKKAAQCRKRTVGFSTGIEQSLIKKSSKMLPLMLGKRFSLTEIL